jgi:hypothetical protein
MQRDEETEIADLVRRHAQDAPTKGGITIHGPVFIGDHNHIGHGTPPPERISEGQSRLLKALVGEITRKEREREATFPYARVWGKANALVGVDHHRDILKRDFDRAKDFLQDWLKRLETGG